MNGWLLFYPNIGLLIIFISGLKVDLALSFFVLVAVTNCQVPSRGNATGVAAC